MIIPYASEPILVSVGTPYGEARSPIYTLLDDFSFEGIRARGRFRAVKVLVSSDNSEPVSVRLYDRTNAAVLAETTGITSIERTLITLGNVAPLPDDEAILEVHARYDVDPSYCRIHSLTMES